MYFLILSLLPLAILGLSCANDGNIVTCSQAKPDIAKITTKAELEAVENASGKNGCIYLTYDEDARLALDKGDYIEATRIMSILTVFYPDAFPLMGRLAAAHANLAGVEAVTFIMEMASVENGLFERGKELFPSSGAAWINGKAHIDKALYHIDRKISGEALASLPAADRIMSCAYRLAQSMFIANGFLETTATGDWNQEKLESMTLEDVETILNNIESIAATIPDENMKAQFQEWSESSALTEAEKREMITAVFAKK